MPEDKVEQQRTQEVMKEKTDAELGKLFRAIPSEVRLLFFSSSDRDDSISRSAREVIRGVQRISSKIIFEEHHLGDAVSRLMTSLVMLHDGGCVRARLGQPGARPDRLLT